jgi:hypothetical protein
MAMMPFYLIMKMDDGIHLQGKNYSGKKVIITFYLMTKVWIKGGEDAIKSCLLSFII